MSLSRGGLSQSNVQSEQCRLILSLVEQKNSIQLRDALNPLVFFFMPFYRLL